MRQGLWRDRRAAFGMAVLAIAVAVALFAPLVAGDPIAQGDIVATRFMPPLSSDASGVFHPLGTDRFGRDVWARLAYGARISLGVGSLAVLVSVRRRGSGRDGPRRSSSGSRTSPSRCRASCCCCSSPRCGNRAPDW
jgi:hypothetical protein